MRTVIATILSAGLLATPALAQSSGGGQGVLNGLLNGNQSQDRAVQDAYERGYQKGRQDEARLSSRNPSQRRRDYDSGSQDDQPNGYNRAPNSYGR